MPAIAYRWKDRSGREHIDTARDLLARAAEDEFFEYPYPLLRAMLEDAPRPEGPSITGLNFGCLRCAVLEQYEDFIVDLEARWWAFRGTMFHSVMEKGTQRGSIVEVRFWAPVPGTDQLVHGQVDEVVLKGSTTHPKGTLRDWKFPRKLPKYNSPYGNHVQQLQDYRWLVNNAVKWDQDLGGVDPKDIEFERLGVVYISDEDVKPLVVTRSVEVPTKPGAKNPYKTERVPDIWSDEEVEARLVDRFNALTTAYAQYEGTGELPPYPPGFDFMRSWIHKYSPVAERCVETHIESLRKEVA